ncbi:MAG: hypothetical protein HY372_02695 [Candidatus Andersenbacteria bacterium]|nr:hypothetical protein [Candidatus Andersenbacteria bacterium]
MTARRARHKKINIRAWLALAVTLAATAVVLTGLVRASHYLATTASTPATTSVPGGVDWELPAAPYFGPLLYKIDACPARPSPTPTAPSVIQPPAPAQQPGRVPAAATEYRPSPAVQPTRCERAKSWGTNWLKALGCPLSGTKPDESGRVAGSRLAHLDVDVSCRPAADGAVPHKYAPEIMPLEQFPNLTRAQYEIPGGGAIYPWPINGATAVEIMAVACGDSPGWRNPPLCGNIDAIACTQLRYGDMYYDHFRSELVDRLYSISLGALYHQYMKSGWLRPREQYVQLSLGLVTPDHTEKSAVEVQQLVYPAAQVEKQPVPVWHVVSMWELSRNDADILRRRDPTGTLLRVAEAAVQNTKRHEMEHVKINREFIPRYFELFNNPSNIFHETIAAPDTQQLSATIRGRVLEDWWRIHYEHRAAHTRFHQEEEERKDNTWTSIPQPGLTSFRCRQDVIASIFGKSA